ncbi:MAG: hypothetical protein FWG85_07240, partial [Bacteroidetes bacterium]|nr:hypothetical protein [Bacteroidota bacterium]
IIRFEQCEYEGKPHNIFIIKYDKIKDFTTEHRCEILHDYSWDFVEENFDFGEIKFNNPVIVRLEYYEANETKHFDMLIVLFNKITNQLDLTHTLQHAIATFIIDIKDDVPKNEEIKDINDFKFKEYDDHNELFMRYEKVKDLVENETTIHMQDIIDALLKDVDLSKNFEIYMKYDNSCHGRICLIEDNKQKSKQTLINEIITAILAYISARKKDDCDLMLRHKRWESFNNIFKISFDDKGRKHIGETKPFVDCEINCEINVDYNKIIKLSTPDVIKKCKQYFSELFINKNELMYEKSVITINFVNEYGHRMFEKLLIYDSNSVEKMSLMIVETVKFLEKYHKDTVNVKSLWTEKDIERVSGLEPTGYKKIHEEKNILKKYEESKKIKEIGIDEKQEHDTLEMIKKTIEKIEPDEIVIDGSDECIKEFCKRHQDKIKCIEKIFGNVSDNDKDSEKQNKMIVDEVKNMRTEINTIIYNFKSLQEKIQKIENMLCNSV